MDNSQTYQIKSTPFMRRMVSRSTKNGELQRLKQEYERIKNFNERTIENQVRHARLRRLYRVIEIIKETQPERARARAKNQEQIRAAQINRARQMGMEFSRQNALPMGQHSLRQAPHQRPQQLRFRFENYTAKEDAERRQRSSRRLAYGNDFSRHNREQILQGTTRRATTLQCAEQTDQAEEKRKLLLKRIEYGNKRSDLNLVQLQRIKSATQEQQSDMAQIRWLDSINKTHSQWASAAVSAELIQENVEEPIAKMQETILEQELPTQTQSSIQEVTLTPEIANEDDTLKMAPGVSSPRADSTLQQVGRYVLDALKKPFSSALSKSTSGVHEQSQEEQIRIKQQTSVHRRTSSLERVQVDDAFDDDYEQTELHQVSNSTNLPGLYEQVKVRDLGSSSSESELPSSSLDDTMTPDELVLSCQRYMDNISESESKRQRYPSKYERIMDLRTKLVEPISTQAMDKEQLLTLKKVSNMRAIFEN